MNARTAWYVVALAGSICGASCNSCRGETALSDMSMADLQEEVRRISPPDSSTTRFGGEQALMGVLLAVAPERLSRFKFDLEYDLDDKDMVEYVFHDIDDKQRQNTIKAHYLKAPAQGGIKVLTDVDDTMYANLVDKRYGNVRDEDGAKPLYPGILAFYNSMKHEPFEGEGVLVTLTGVTKVPVTTLSARPNPFAGELERASLQKLAALPSPAGTRLKLLPSGLSGAIVSSTLGSAETVVRARIERRLQPDQRILDALHDQVPDGQETKIGEVKFRNFLEFAAVYPEYRYVFVGDSGQADALTAQLLITTSDPASSRVVTTFIHALKADDNVKPRKSKAFDALLPAIRVGEQSPSGRGVIVFRNYIDAAVIAYSHRATLRDPATSRELITAQELAVIVESALAEFEAQAAGIASSAQALLRQEYSQDAAKAADLLAAEPSLSPAVERIRATLSSRFWRPGALG